MGWLLQETDRGAFVHVTFEHRIQGGQEGQTFISRKICAEASLFEEVNDCGNVRLCSQLKQCLGYRKGKGVQKLTVLFALIIHPPWIVTLISWNLILQVNSPLNMAGPRGFVIRKPNKWGNGMNRGSAEDSSCPRPQDSLIEVCLMGGGKETTLL